MKTRIINILANEENKDILKFVKDKGINFIMVYHKRNLIIPALFVNDIRHIDNFVRNELTITLKDSLHIYCSSIHFCDIETDTIYVYSKDEDEFYEQTM